MALGDRHFDVSHRAVIVGLVDDLETLDGVLGHRPEALATTSSLAGAVCDRVDVPVGVVNPPHPQLVFGDEAVDVAGPFPGDAPRRMAQVADAIIAGERVIVSTDVRSDRRVAEVLARILAARAPS